MTSPYRKVLVAIDCSDESAEVLSRAAGVQEGTDGELHLIHVIEPLALAYGADVPMDVVGLAGGRFISINGGHAVDLIRLKQAHEGFMPALMDGEPEARVAE